MNFSIYLRCMFHGNTSSISYFTKTIWKVQGMPRIPKIVIVLYNMVTSWLFFLLSLTMCKIGVSPLLPHWRCTCSSPMFNKALFKITANRKQNTLLSALRSLMDGLVSFSIKAPVDTMVASVMWRMQSRSATEWPTHRNQGPVSI